VREAEGREELGLKARNLIAWAKRVRRAQAQVVCPPKTTRPVRPTRPLKKKLVRTLYDIVTVTGQAPADWD